MGNKIFFILLISVILFLGGCKKIEWNLPRDNSLDSNKGIVQVSKSLIVKDDNNDGIANKGEDIYIIVYLKNNDRGESHVQGTVSCSSSYISQFEPTTSLSYGNIASGTENYGYYYSYSPNKSSPYTAFFHVSNLTPSGTEIIFNMTIADKNNTWTDSFIITVY